MFLNVPVIYEGITCDTRFGFSFFWGVAWGVDFDRSNRDRELISSVGDWVSQRWQTTFDDGENMATACAAVPCRLVNLVCGVGGVGVGRDHCCHECIAFYHTEFVCLSACLGVWAVGGGELWSFMLIISMSGTFGAFLNPTFLRLSFSFVCPLLAIVHRLVGYHPFKFFFFFLASWLTLVAHPPSPLHLTTYKSTNERARKVIFS